MAGRREKRARQVQRQQTGMPSLAWRRRGVLGLFLLAGSVLIWRAVDQQVLEKDRLQQAGTERYLMEIELQAHRGLITDRRGDVLALSTPVYTVAADPRVLRPDSPGLASLAKALEMSLDELQQRLARAASRHFVALRKRMPPDEADYVLAVADAYELDGVYRQQHFRRYYPTGEVFSHLVGFTNHRDEGQEGLELEYEQDLAGSDGLKRVLRDGRRRAVADVESIRAQRDGANLALSLDGRLQYLAYRELKAAVRRHRAIGGSAVLLDVRTGEVLAMVNQPGFNPNRSRSNENGRLRNRAITHVFQPGSTMKPLTVAAALEVGGLEIDDLVDTSPGRMKVRGGTVRDHHNLGVIDLQTLLGKSSNVGVAKLALQLQREDFWRMLDRFGFGRAPQMRFPAKADGRLIPWRDWAEIDQASIAFGYAISVSTLQLASAYAVLANDGVKLPVSLLKLEQAPQGQRVLSAQTAQAVRQLLESVTREGGTAPEAAVPGYRVAGKTGTTKKGRPDAEESRYVSVFAGMAPLTDPRLVMVVMVNEPRGREYYGGKVAGPVFSEVMGEALRLLNVKPDGLAKPQLRLAKLGAPQAGPRLGEAR